MTEQDKFLISNDLGFTIALDEATNQSLSKNSLKVYPFHTIGDRINLITNLERNGFTIARIDIQKGDAMYLSNGDLYFVHHTEGNMIYCEPRTAQEVEDGTAKAFKRGQLFKTNPKQKSS